MSSSSISAGQTVSLSSNPPTNQSIPVTFHVVSLGGTHELTAGPYSETLTITIHPNGL